MNRLDSSLLLDRARAHALLKSHAKPTPLRRHANTPALGKRALGRRDVHLAEELEAAMRAALSAT